MPARHRARSWIRGATAGLTASALTAGALLAVADPGSAVSASSDPNTIVSNGDFASPQVAGGFVDLGVGGTMGAWIVTAGTVDLVSNSNWQQPPSDPSTTQSVDMDGYSPGTISQVIPTSAGWTYTGSFELASNPGSGGVTTGTFSAGSTTEALTFDGTGRSASDMGWTNVPFSFVATSASTALTFTSTTPGTHGIVITDVVVDPPQAPAVTSIADERVLQTTTAGTPVDFTAPTASDPNNANAALAVSCDHSSGSMFAVGTTTVTCSATSPSGPSASSSFKVVVVAVASACEGRALGFDAARHLSIGQSNAQTSPCVAASGTVASTNVTLVSGLLGLGATRANGTALDSRTTASFGPTSATVGATEDIASIRFVAPGIQVEATTIHVQAAASLSLDCSGTTSASSDIQGLVINGKHYNVGSAPLVIRLGAGLLLNINQQIVAGGVITQRAFAITSVYPNNYHTVIGEALAGLSC